MLTQALSLAHSLFISDLHLCESRLEMTASFITFLQKTASHAEALYILGDFFEYWVGDDDLDNPAHQAIIHALYTLSKSGTKLFIMHGNRDFLLGDNFCSATCATLLADPVLISLYGHPTILSHGDALCTDDVAYQTFRREVRTDAWRANFLAQPLTSRHALVKQLREQSEVAKAEKSAAIMDVNQAAVEQLLCDYGYTATLIHGHTHRPAMHTLTVNNHAVTRYVLGDWYEQGNYLRVDANGIKVYSLES